MPKVVVIYDSQTGNTEKMAKAVVDGVRMVEMVEVELLKVGTPFSISKLKNANAIILGSPSRYGSITAEMKEFLEAVKEHKDSKKLEFSRKVGGVFGSYAWDGGWVTDKLEADVKALGIRIVTSAVSAVDQMGVMGTRIDEASLKRCRELGRFVAEKASAAD